MWVRSREYTGRIVTVSNAKIFESPSQLLARFPVSVGGDGIADQLRGGSLREMQRRYVLKTPDLQPKVYFRLTDNRLELTVRFIVRDHGIRGLKDAMSRDILDELDDAGIGLASTTFEIVGLPPLRIEPNAKPWHDGDDRGCRGSRRSAS